MSRTDVCVLSPALSAVIVCPAEPLQDHLPAASQCLTTSYEPQSARDMSRQQWEALKPLIKRVYIDENKPFPYLADILRQDHGFEPTKRQFSRKVAEWGFRKNVSRSERRTILQSCSGCDGIPELKDPRIREGKVRNWKRRYRDEFKTLMIAQTKPLAVEGMRLGKGVESTTPPTTSSPEVLQGIMIDPFLFDMTLYEPQQTPPDEIMTASYCQLLQDHWPFDWATVDVPGSPGLSRLFKALDLENSSSVPSLSLHMSVDSASSSEPPFLSDAEMQDLFLEPSLSQADDWSCTPFPIQPTESTIGQATHQTSQGPWRNSNGAIFSFHPSPLNEIYIFPSSPSPAFGFSGKSPTTEVALWVSLDAQENELETKLSKLKRQFGTEHPAVVAVMETLSDVYYQHSQYKKAERLRRRLVNLHKKLYGGTSLKPLETCRRVIHALLGQGRYSEAQKLHRDLRSTILKRVHPEHNLAVHAMETQAIISGALGHGRDEETLLRETLQVRLKSLGPRNKETLFSLTQLACSLAQTHPAECRKLLYIAMQLSLELSDPVIGELCWIMRRLSADCWEQREYEEGYNLANTALQRYSPSLGAEHPVILETQLELAWNLSELGRLPESEAIFRSVVELQSKAACEAHPLGLSGGYSGLARFLMTTGQYEEAVTFYETIFQARLEAYGPASNHTFNTCLFLGACYERLEKYEEAWQVYRRAVEGMRAEGRSDNQSIVELEENMRRLECLLAERAAETMSVSPQALLWPVI